MSEQTTPGSDERIALPRYSDCFVCGCKNPIGLDITFYYTNGRIETTFTPGPEHAGYHKIVHGGILATLLDETMGWASILSRPVMCVAADLSVRYKQSAVVGERLLIYGELVTDKKRMMLVKGGIEREDGTLLCLGEGKIFPLSPEEQKSVIDYAHWGDTFTQTCEKIHTLYSQRKK